MSQLVSDAIQRLMDECLITELIVVNPEIGKTTVFTNRKFK